MPPEHLDLSQNLKIHPDFAFIFAGILSQFKAKYYDLQE